MENSASAQNVRAVLLVALIGTLFLPACGSLDTREVDWVHGAKRAFVEKIYSSSDLRGDNIPSCLKGISESERVLGKYVEVTHREGRAVRWKPARVADGLTVSAGDEVELYPIECSAKTMPVVRKVLRRTYL